MELLHVVPLLPNSDVLLLWQGPPCSQWNCTCDTQIRAKRSSAALLGAMFLFADGEADDDSGAFQCCKFFYGILWTSCMSSNLHVHSSYGLKSFYLWALPQKTTAIMFIPVCQAGRLFLLIAEFPCSNVGMHSKPFYHRIQQS